MSKKIAVCCQGSRGDFQPALALSLGLKKAGFTVQIFGNAGHVKTSVEFGIEAWSISQDFADLMESKRVQVASESGEFFRIATSELYADDPKDIDVAHYYKGFHDKMSKFAPDVIVHNSLITWPVREYNELHPEVPVVLMMYQPHGVPSNTYDPVGPTQDMEVDPDMPIVYRHVMGIQGQADELERRKAKRKEKGLEPWIRESAHAMWEEFFNIEEWPVPKLCCHSPAWWGAPSDWPKSGVEITGSWKIGKEEQEELVRKGSAFFTSGPEHEACVEFLKAGPTPVYIGWGSMLVFGAGHMTQLAVGALRRAGKRGVVISGWAKLSVDALDGAENADELKEYARQNVLFLKKAPHEWLMPQCLCAVHHGGIGTTQASLAAGLPTIITAVFADQASIGKKITDDRCGVATSHLSKVTPEELGDAIRRCSEDERMQSIVKALAGKMQSEDGVARAVELIQQLGADMDSGKFKERLAALDSRLRDKTDRMKKISGEKLSGLWTQPLMKKYKVYEDYVKGQQAKTSQMLELAKEKKLWWVKAAGGVLAREGENLKSKEAGRYGVYAILHEVELRGKRLRVKRLAGTGPDEGWVSSEASGKQILEKFADFQEIGAISGKRIQKMFEFMVGADEPPDFLIPLGLAAPKNFDYLKP